MDCNSRPKKQDRGTLKIAIVSAATQAFQPERNTRHRPRRTSLQVVSYLTFTLPKFCEAAAV
jgi:hypothetical protein